MNLTKANFFAIASFLILILTFYYSDRVIAKTASLNSSIYIKNFDADLLEYHTVAVNLSEFGKFPYIGFLGQKKCYNFSFIDKKGNFGSHNFISDFFDQSGVAKFIRKPPVYFCVLAGLYKIFGVNAKVVFAFHFFLLGITVFFLMILGRMLIGNWGVLAGLIAGLINFHLKEKMALTIDPEITLTFLIVMAFIFDAWMRKQEHITGRYFQGLIFGLAILTRGTVIPFLAMYILWRLYFAVKEKNGFPVTGLFAGVLTILIPWMIYANTFNARHETERMEWSKKNRELMPDFFALQKAYTAKREVTDDVINFIYRREYDTYAGTKKIIIVSPQAEGDQAISMHNEFCVDGNFHFDWILIKNSYHNTHHLSSSTSMRIVLFYLSNPEMVLKIFMAKLAIEFSDIWRIIDLILLFISLCFIVFPNRVGFPMFPISALLTSLLASVFISFSGDPFFIASSDGLTLLYFQLVIIQLMPRFSEKYL
jgi:4-amino-4-deoxy-L-arabinose transferase-like glycosyltransferase